jgi:hypothetical protein
VCVLCVIHTNYVALQNELSVVPTVPVPETSCLGTFEERTLVHKSVACRSAGSD